MKLTLAAALIALMACSGACFAQRTTNGAASSPCDNPSQRDATCSGYANKMGMRPTDNVGGGMQAITNARAIPEKPNLLPIGLIIGAVKLPLPPNVPPSVCARKPEVCEGYEY